MVHIENRTFVVLPSYERDTITSTWVTTDCCIILPAHQRLLLLLSVMAHVLLLLSIALEDSVIPGSSVDDSFVQFIGTTVIAVRMNAGHVCGKHSK